VWGGVGGVGVGMWGEKGRTHGGGLLRESFAREVMGWLGR